MLKPDERGQFVVDSQEITVPRVVAHIVNSCVRTKVAGSRGEFASSSTGEDERTYARRFFLNTRGGEAMIGGAIGSSAGTSSGIDGITSVDTGEVEGMSTGWTSGEGMDDSTGGLVNADESNESKSYGCGEATGAADTAS